MNTFAKLAAALVLLTAAAPAVALASDKEDICRAYALEAVNWNQIAHKKNCVNLTAPVWSNNHQMHFDWCMHGNNYKMTAKSNLDRAEYVQSCQTAQVQPPPPVKLQDPQPNGACAAYANEAVKTAAKAEVLGCGFVGGRWLQDYKAHYDFCTTADPALVISEHTARESQFAVCSAN